MASLAPSPTSTTAGKLAMYAGMISLVVGEEAVFLRVIDDRIIGEIEIRLLAIDLYLGLPQRSFPAIGSALIVGTKNHGVPAFQAEPQFVVVVTDLGKFLAHHRLDHLIVGSGLRVDDFWLRAQSLMVYVKGERAILQQDAFQK